MKEIELIDCKMNCFDNETFNFFGEHEADCFVVRWCFNDGNENYTLLTTHKTANNGNMCIMGSEILYNYGNRCFITGYCPIKIKNKKN